MNLTEFIKTRVTSLNELRALLLFQSSPRVERDITEVGGKLYLRHSEAAAAINTLVARGILSSSDKPGHYLYRPSDELALLVDQLAEMDRKHPVTLINLIFDHTRDIQAFADAFKLKPGKEKPED